MSAFNWKFELLPTTYLQDSQLYFAGWLSTNYYKSELVITSSTNGFTGLRTCTRLTSRAYGFLKDFTQIHAVSFHLTTHLQRSGEARAPGRRDSASFPELRFFEGLVPRLSQNCTVGILGIPLCMVTYKRPFHGILGKQDRISHLWRPRWYANYLLKRSSEYRSRSYYRKPSPHPSLQVSVTRTLIRVLIRRSPYAERWPTLLS